MAGQRRARSWPYWSEAKLEVLEDYLSAFTRACKRAREIVYLDAFAGGPRNLSETTGAEIEGSALIALHTQPPFSKLRYFELPGKAGELERAIRPEARGRDVRVTPGDCNETIPTVLGELRPFRWAPTFAFIDPEGMEVAWETLAALAAHRDDQKTKVELWLLFPSAGLCRTLALRRRPSMRDVGRATRLFGTDQWKVIYTARALEHFSGAEARNEYVNLMRWRLETVLGYRWTHQWEVRNVHGPLYHMIFATDSEPGHKIMTHLYNQAAAKEPAMLADARQKEHDERVGAMPLFHMSEVVGGSANVYAHEPPWEPPSVVE